MLAEDLGEGRGIDPGQRNIGTDARHDQGAQGEPDSLLQLFGLGEGAEIDVGG